MRARSSWMLGLALFCSACEDPKFDSPLTLGSGQVVPPSQLKAGYEAYMQYCRPCHGDKGDGRGYSAYGLRPPPRDFTQQKFKFGGVNPENLPPDSELKRIVRGGLHGTAMLPWDITDRELDAVLQYIKTFPKRACVEQGGKPEECKSRWETEAPGTPVAKADPKYEGQRKTDAIEQGKRLYHAKAQCSGSCHPNYVTHQELFEISKAMTGTEMTAFSPEMYHAQPKDSEYCLEWKAGWKKLDERECALPVKVMPVDFTRDPVRAGTSPAELFRTIGSGIGGAGMPPWTGTLTDDELWALAYYVGSLTDLKGTPAVKALHQKLQDPANLAWLPPPKAEPAVPGTPAAPGTSAPSAPRSNTPSR